MTSGDIQYGVPTNVFFFADSVPESCPDTPKSASLTSPPAESNTFAAAGAREKWFRGWLHATRTLYVAVQFPLSVEVL